MRLSVCVSQGSTLVFRTISGEDRGANACADAGRSWTGIVRVATERYVYQTDIDDVSDAMDGYGRRLQRDELKVKKRRNMSQMVRTTGLARL